MSRDLALKLDTDHFDLVRSAMPEEVEEIGFEEIQKEMGIMLIYVTRDRRNFYHLQTETLDKAWKEQVQVHVQTYRGSGPLAFTIGKCVLQVAKMATLTMPEYSVMPHENVAGTLNETKKTWTGILNYGDGAVDTVKQLFDTSLQGNREEARSQADHLKSLAEQKRQENLRALSEEGDMIRKYEQQRNKQEDFMISMAK